MASGQDERTATRVPVGKPMPSIVGSGRYAARVTSSLLIFVHDAGQNPQSWQDQVVELPAGIKALAPWLLGTRPGRTSEFSLAGAADDVLGLIVPNGYDRAAICGVGVGASVAIEAAIRAPQAVSRLILAAPQPQFTARDVRAMRWAVQVTPEARLRAMGIDKTRTLELPKVLGSKSQKQAFEQVRVPTLIIVSADDKAQRLAADNLAKAMPQVRIETVPGAAPQPNLAQPALFNRALYGFLAE